MYLHTIVSIILMQVVRVLRVLTHSKAMIRFIKCLFGWWKGRTIDKKVCKEIVCFVWKAEKLSSKHQVVEYDKIYHHTLKKLWYEGTFWEILKQKPSEISNLNEVWELHKFRNTLVHELRDLDERFILKQSKKYKTVVEKFVKQVTK